MNDDLVTQLTARNRIFAQHAFAPSDTMMPRLKTMVIAGCPSGRRPSRRWNTRRLEPHRIASH